MKSINSGGKDPADTAQVGCALARTWNVMSEVSEQLLERVRLEIDKANQELREEHERLLAEREKLELQISALEKDMGTLRRLESQSDGTDLSRPAPLSHRVIAILERSQSDLTFRQIREQLQLDHRESRNLGPVLNQLMRAGKVASAGRGAPWHLVSARHGSAAAAAAKGERMAAAREVQL